MNLLIGRLRDDGVLYLGIDENCQLTDGEPLILIRAAWAHEQPWVMAKFFNSSTWAQIDFFKAKDPKLEMAVKAWGKFLGAMMEVITVVCSCSGANPFALTQQTEVKIMAGVITGLSPHETGLRHYAHHGGADVRRIAMANRAAFPNDPQSVGLANKASFGDVKKIAKANRLAFEDDWTACGLANRAVFGDPETIGWVIRHQASIHDLGDREPGSSEAKTLVALAMATVPDDDKRAICLGFASNLGSALYANDIEFFMLQLKLLYPNGGTDDDKIIAAIKTVGKLYDHGDAVGLDFRARFLVMAAGIYHNNNWDLAATMLPVLCDQDEKLLAATKSLHNSAPK